MQRKNITVRAHAVLTGLRKVVMDAPAELGGDAFTARAAEELERILFLKEEAV